MREGSISLGNAGYYLNWIIMLEVVRSPCIRSTSCNRAIDAPILLRTWLGTKIDNGRSS